LLQHPEDDRLRGRDVGARERLRPLGVTRHDGLEDRAVLAPGVFEPMRGPQQQRVVPWCCA